MGKKKKSQQDKAFCNLLKRAKLDQSTILKQLSVYVFNHASFSFYAAIDDKKQYDDKKFYLFFGLPDRWEDKEDKEKYKKHISKDEFCFVRCLSYQQSESIAMWHMYGLPNNIRITIDDCSLINGLDLKKKHKKLSCYLILKKNRVGEKFSIESSKIENFDMLYYVPNKDGSTYFVQKDADIVVKKVDGESIIRLKNEFYLKRYAFAAEVETRLQIRLKKNFLQGHLPKGISLDDICGLAVEPDFKKEDFEKIHIYKRPEFLEVKDIRRKPSIGRAVKYIKNEKYPKTLYSDEIKLENSKLDEEEINMKKIEENKKKEVKAKAKKKLDKLTKFTQDEVRMKEINDFKTKFEICEILFKQLYIQYKKDQGEAIDNIETLTLDMKKARGVLSHFGYEHDMTIITKLFGAKAKKSAKCLRNALTHDFNESDAQDLHNRMAEIDGYMDYFLNLIRNQNV